MEKKVETTIITGYILGFYWGYMGSGAWRLRVQI